MGQRHQFFLITPNPIYGVKTKDLKNPGVNPKLKEIFGTKKETVLAYHHQWLYGNTAAVNALKLLDFISKFKGDSLMRYNNLFDPEYIENNMRWMDDPYTAWADRVTNFMSLFTHPALDQLGVGYRYGYERIHFLNEEEPEMMSNFDNGDNNDGISIIDTINNKYCFMVIGTHQTEDINKNHLLYQPLSAVEYVKTFYYPRKQHKTLQKLFKPYEVMTHEEIEKYWPNYKSIRKEIEKEFEKV